MPRGFRVDHQATLLRFGEAWKPGQSFVSLPKIIEGECTEPQPHLVLYGEKDKGVVRAEIFRLNRLENDGVNRCWKCKKIVFEDEARSNAHPDHRGEWHHPRNKPGMRCDCESNGVVSCPACHREEHKQPQFGRRKIVENSR